jgi:hypothetical protein
MILKVDAAFAFVSLVTFPKGFSLGILQSAKLGVFAPGFFRFSPYRQGKAFV